MRKYIKTKKVLAKTPGTIRELRGKYGLVNYKPRDVRSRDIVYDREEKAFCVYMGHPLDGRKWAVYKYYPINVETYIKLIKGNLIKKAG